MADPSISARYGSTTVCEKKHLAALRSRNAIDQDTLPLCKNAGIVRINGFVLPNNVAMLALAKAQGFKTHRGEDSLIHIELDLSAIGKSIASSCNGHSFSAAYGT
jgi:hypothetical protein